MPFQVVYSVYQAISKGVIFDFTAGDDIVSMCSTQVTLQATIYGDPQGHRFLWEQLEGSDVTWETSQTDLTVSVSFSKYDDKKFRFWIDKGAKNERYDDVWVWGTPTEQHIHKPGTTSQSNTNIAYFGGCRKLECSDVEAITNIFSSPVYGFAECDSTNYLFRFLTPLCNVDHILYYRIQEKKSSGQYQTIGTVQPDSTGIHYYTSDNIKTETTYRIVPVYQLNYHNTQYDYMFACDILTFDYGASATDGKIDGVDWIRVDPGVNSIDNVDINNYDVRVRTKIEREATEDFTASTLVNTIDNVDINNYDVRVRTKIEREATEDFTASTLVNTIDNTELTNYSVLARDGSQVGG